MIVKRFVAAALVAVALTCVMPGTTAKAAVVPVSSGATAPLVLGQTYSFGGFVPAGDTLSFGFEAGPALVGNSAVTSVSLEGADITASWTSDAFGAGTVFATESASGNPFASVELSTVFAAGEEKWLNLFSAEGSTVALQVNATPVPLPASALLLLGGLGGLGGLSALRRRKRAA